MPRFDNQCYAILSPMLRYRVPTATPSCPNPCSEERVIISTDIRMAVLAPDGQACPASGYGMCGGPR
jgi:hypothetical protein